MNNLASLEMRVDLKERTGRSAKERNEEPAFLVAYTAGILPDAEPAHIAGIRRRG
jgi:hypothetical protein